MNEKLLRDLTCTEFADVLASKAPVPGGGGVAAMVGAFGAALCSMVGNLTVGRKKYAEFEPDVLVMLEKGERVRTRLLELVDQDATAFEPLSKAYSIPKDDPTRDAVLEAVTLSACKAPFEMMKSICEAIDLLEEMMDKGSVTLVSDVGCGALCCKAALVSASMNIFVNTKTVKDKSKVSGMEAETDAMLVNYGAKADRVAEEVMRRLRSEV